MNWPQIAQIGGGAALTLLGAKMSGGAANQNANRQWELVQEEMRRRNALQGMIAPQLLYAAGIRNPQQIQQHTRQIGAPPGGASMGSGGGGGPVPTAGSGAASTALKLGSAGLGAAALVPGVGKLAAGALGALGVPGAAIPFVGPALLGASLAVGQIGKGRRTADLLTDPEKGAEGRLVAVLRNPSASADELKAAYDAYRQTVEAFRAQGGNHRKVAEQSLANRPLQDTIAARLRELGVG